VAAGHRRVRLGETAVDGDLVYGRELQGDGDGFWVGPTLFDQVTTDASIYTDEIAAARRRERSSVRCRSG
jgi:acyl-CoA reductase-like NAD-dependent aldehyde dehydrogenase